MSIKFTKLSQILIATFISSYVIAEPAKAESIPETFREAYFENSGNAFQNGTIRGQLEFILGIDGFPETKISRDGKLIDIIYKDVMKQQAQSGPRLVTRDLSNPFQTSVSEHPEYNNRINNSVVNPKYNTGL